jgi:hypothetical protein
VVPILSPANPILFTTQSALPVIELGRLIAKSKLNTPAGPNDEIIGLLLSDGDFVVSLATEVLVGKSGFVLMH